MVNRVPTKTEVEPTNFQPPRVDNGRLGAKLAVTSEGVGQKTFTMNILNQSGKVFSPLGMKK